MYGTGCYLALTTNPHCVAMTRFCYLHVSSINLVVSLRCCKSFIFNSALSHPG